MTLELALRHRFATGRSLDLAVSAPLPGIVGLFGPSGAGKSSLVAALCGLFRPDWSEIRIDGRVLSGPGVWVRPERRRIGMVFQDSRLFPHLSVAANLRYGARRARGVPAEGLPGFEEVVALLGLQALLARRTRALSGGERQRVAIGRALLSRPLLLALDEPLSGLDAARRAEILPYLMRLRDQLRLPMLYVTHALDEAVRLCDTLALIEDGRCVGCGPVAAVLAASGLAARADAQALLDGAVVAHDRARRLTRVQAGGFTLLVPLDERAVGTRLRLGVPAREVILLHHEGGLPATSAQNVLPVRVREVRPLDESGLAVVVLEPGSGVADQVMLSRITADSVRRLGLQPGSTLLALVKSVSIMVPGLVFGSTPATEDA